MEYLNIPLDKMHTIQSSIHSQYAFSLVWHWLHAFVLRFDWSIAFIYAQYDPKLSLRKQPTFREVATT